VSEAESLSRRALELDPNESTDASNLANFIRYVRKDDDEAERLYRRALELNPNDGDISAISRSSLQCAAMILSHGNLQTEL
jgi:Flp pilus assembly protein TadD